MISGRLRPHIAMMVMALAFSGEFEDERRRRLDDEPPAWGRDAEELAAALPITVPVAETILRAKGRDMAAARALVERAMAEGVDPLHLLEVERAQGPSTPDAMSGDGPHFADRRPIPSVTVNLAPGEVCTPHLTNSGGACVLPLSDVERAQGERLTIGAVAVDHAIGRDETAVIKVDVHSGTIRSLNLDVQVDGCERIQRSAARRFNALADAAYRTSGALDRLLDESDERIRRREAKRERAAVARKALKRRRGW